MSDLPGLLERITASLGRAEVPFMIAGSFASTAHGMPRSTQDLDLVIDPATAAALERLLGELPDGAYYVDRDAARDAYRRRAMFNVIDLATAWKIDLILRKDRAFSREEFGRRRPVSLLGVDVFIASPEDTIVAKLEWSRHAGGLQRQRRDVAGILAMCTELDRGYLERWIGELALVAEWELAQATTLD